MKIDYVVTFRLLAPFFTRVNSSLGLKGLRIIEKGKSDNLIKRKQSIKALSLTLNISVGPVN